MTFPALPSALLTPPTEEGRLLGILKDKDRVWFQIPKEIEFWPGLPLHFRANAPVIDHLDQKIELLPFAQPMTEKIWLYLGFTPWDQEDFLFLSFPQLCQYLPQERGRITYIKALQFLSDFPDSVRVISGLT